MSMYEIIKGGAVQFNFEPKIENAENFKHMDKYIVAGMGGSHLAGDLLKLINPELDVIMHSNYGLPSLPHESLKERLVILSSYSGNTEETLDAYEKAGELGLARAVIAVGGKLLELAKKDGVPYILMPDLNIEPRCATVLSLKSFLKFINDEKSLEIMTKMEDTFIPENFENQGKELAQKLKNYVPVIYSSTENKPINYIWKIKFNESGKIPAFYNIFPELNHNELNSFDVVDATRALSGNFCFIFLKDKNDHEKVQKRMSVTEKMYQARNLKTIEVEIVGIDTIHRIFNMIAIADFTAYFTALEYGLKSDEVPMVEEFKKLIA